MYYHSTNTVFAARSIRYCPRCASPDIAVVVDKQVSCRNCHFSLFMNTATAAAALLFNTHGELLLVKRAQEPQKGKWTLPGGFVDYDESAENAVIREVKEETHLSVKDLKFVLSYPNRYTYKHIIYHTVDLMFTATVEDWSALNAQDEVDAIDFRGLHTIQAEEIAFPAVWQAIISVRVTQSLTR